MHDILSYFVMKLP